MILLFKFVAFHQLTTSRGPIDGHVLQLLSHHIVHGEVLKCKTGTTGNIWRAARVATFHNSVNLWIQRISQLFMNWKGSNFKPTKSAEFREVVVPGACYLEMILAGVKAHLGAQVRMFACRWLVDRKRIFAHFFSFSEILKSWDAGSLVYRKPGLC